MAVEGLLTFIVILLDVQRSFGDLQFFQNKAPSKMKHKKEEEEAAVRARRHAIEVVDGR